MSTSRLSEDRELQDGLQLSDGNTDWVARQAALGVPLVLPWKQKPIRLGTCFQSQLLSRDPWLKENPFILSDLYIIPKILCSEYGSTSSFHSINTTRKSETGDHLSLGFGMGVGLPFLVHASVKGSYDEQVKNNNDSEKSSIRASVRNATVQLERNPRLSHEAMVELKYGGGYKAFVKRYGDYFVWGYRLGGDAGVLLSRSSFSTKKTESYSIKATLEVLVFETSKTWTKDFFSSAAGKSMRLVGYDTLSGRNWSVNADGSNIGKLFEDAEKVILKSQTILERTVRLLEEQKLSDGDELSHAQCEYLTARGIAVELVLLPMSALRDVARWTTEHDVI